MKASDNQEIVSMRVGLLMIFFGLVGSLSLADIHTCSSLIVKQNQKSSTVRKYLQTRDFVDSDRSGIGQSAPRSFKSS
jgi:hypothetical protein